MIECSIWVFSLTLIHKKHPLHWRKNSSQTSVMKVVVILPRFFFSFSKKCLEVFAQFDSSKFPFCRSVFERLQQKIQQIIHKTTRIIIYKMFGVGSAGSLKFFLFSFFLVTYHQRKSISYYSVNILRNVKVKVIKI